jgi:hypothetical protein
MKELSSAFNIHIHDSVMAAAVATKKSLTTEKERT